MRLVHNLSYLPMVTIWGGKGVSIGVGRHLLCARYMLIEAGGRGKKSQDFSWSFGK